MFLRDVEFWIILLTFWWELIFLSVRFVYLLLLFNPMPCLSGFPASLKSRWIPTLLEKRVPSTKSPCSTLTDSRENHLKCTKMACLRQTPLTCSGHTRPVVDLAFSDVSENGYFLISACKGDFVLYFNKYLRKRCTLHLFVLMCRWETNDPSRRHWWLDRDTWRTQRRCLGRCFDEWRYEGCHWCCWLQRKGKSTQPNFMHVFDGIRIIEFYKLIIVVGRNHRRGNEIFRAPAYRQERWLLAGWSTTAHRLEWQAPARLWFGAPGCW